MEARYSGRHSIGGPVLGSFTVYVYKYTSPLSLCIKGDLYRV